MTDPDKQALLGKLNHLNHLKNLRKKQAGAVSEHRIEGASRGVCTIVFDLRAEVIHRRQPLRPSDCLFGG